MNRENKKQQSNLQDHAIHESQNQIYQVDWNKVCKEQALCLPSTQPFYSCYQPFISNIPFLQSPFRYPSFEPRLSIPWFQFFPMTYTCQVHVADTPRDFNKAFANTQAPHDEQSKKQMKKTKIQEVDSEYFRIKQESQRNQYLRNKNQINGRQQPFIQPQTNSKVLANTDVSSEITRKDRVNRYKIKKAQRIYEKRIVYQCRKSVADNRQRSKGRFVKQVEITEGKTGGEKFMKEQQNLSG